MQKGLTKEEVIKSRSEYGVNIITPPKKTPTWKLYLDKFDDPIIKILLIAAIFSLIISIIENQYAETLGIIAAIFLATGVSFWFERDAEKKFDILNQVNEDIACKVIRDGKLKEVPRKDIVVNDIVMIESGDEIPADGKLLNAMSLQIDESTLTGELMVEKTTDEAFFDSEATYPSNMVYRGTKVLDGYGSMQVTAVGDKSQQGNVAMNATSESEEETPLNKQLNGLAKFINVIGFSVAILTFLALLISKVIIQYHDYLTNNISQCLVLCAFTLSLIVMLTPIWAPILRDIALAINSNLKEPDALKNCTWKSSMIAGVICLAVTTGGLYIFGINVMSISSWLPLYITQEILQVFMIAVTIIVVAVPEGLPMSVNLSLALSMRRMLQTNNLVRKLHACETMGATTVICTDKTGTLTQNKMSVHDYEYKGVNKKEPFTLNDTTLNIIANITTNSTAKVTENESGEKECLGNHTECALLYWLIKNNINFEQVKDNSIIIAQLPFNTENKYMATIVADKSGNKTLYVKGAPEIVIAKCAAEKAEDKEYIELLKKLLIQYQNAGMRTIAFAYKPITEIIDKHTDIKPLATEMILQGITAIADPVREDVPAAVAQCQNAGIGIKIVTGDTTPTARQIAREIGLWTDNDNDGNIITGNDFANLSDDEAYEKVPHIKVMSRARPADKQRLVSLLQRHGEIVAVTGDGTNDAPALNHAHIGLSMGSGTSVAKDASDITLLDDSFNSIATAVMWGRSLYINIQRFLLFQLTINVAALLLVLIGALIGTDLPLTVTQMLWVNLIMDTFAAAALASLPPQPEVMNNPPRNNNNFIITPKMRKNILSVGITFGLTLLLYLAYNTFCENEHTLDSTELTIFFTTFVMLQFWNLFNAKVFGTTESAFRHISKSKPFLLVLAIVLIGQILIVEFGGEAFRTVHISLQNWIAIVLATSSVLIIGEISRAIKRKKKK